jgi:hypothetical protein
VHLLVHLGRLVNVQLEENSVKLNL